MDEAPWSMTPSAAMRSPARTTIRSPGTSEAASTSSSTPSRSSRARRGNCSMNLPMAASVRPAA